VLGARVLRVACATEAHTTDGVGTRDVIILARRAPRPVGASARRRLSGSVAEVSREVLEGGTRNAPLWGWNSVVIWVVRILELQASNLSGRCIPWNDVQVDVPVLVLEKGVVEMVWRESGSQTRSHQSQRTV
jgi:hypothetical protein